MSGVYDDDDCDVDELRLKKKILERELNKLKAKFELMLETLRETLRLGPDATWVDLLERSQSLLEGQTELDASKPEAEVEELKKKYEVEVEQMAAQMAAQEGHISRLRSLVEKQQELLDATAQQIAEQHQQNKGNAEQIGVLQQIEAEQKEKLAAQTAELSKLRLRCDRDQDRLRQQKEQLEQQQEQIETQDEKLSEQQAQIVELDNQLQQQELLCKTSVAEAREAESQRDELNNTIAEQSEIIEQLREQLRLHEVTERKKKGYNSVGSLTSDKIPIDPGTQLKEKASRESEEISEVAPAPVAERRGSERRASQQGAMSVAAMMAPKEAIEPRDSWLGPSVAERRRSSIRAEDVATAASPAKEMTESERDLLMAHFPMARRTRRSINEQIRKGSPNEKKKSPQK